MQDQFDLQIYMGGTFSQTVRLIEKERKGLEMSDLHGPHVGPPGGPSARFTMVTMGGDLQP
eukprot:1149764-Pelagomonas_calceolata.AAC.1